MPVSAALLAGSEQVVLEGVYHSPVGAVDTQKQGADAEAPESSGIRPWYGSASILDQWLHHVCDPVKA